MLTNVSFIKQKNEMRTQSRMWPPVYKVELSRGNAMGGNVATKHGNLTTFFQLLLFWKGFLLLSFSVDLLRGLFYGVWP